MSIAAPPLPPTTSTASSRRSTARARRSCPSASSKGGWFVRIAIIVVVVIWLIPTDRRAGHLVPPRADRRHHRMVDGVRAIRSERASGRSTTTATSLDAGRLLERVCSTASRSTIPSTVIPITIAAFAAYAFSWMQFRGRYVLFVARRGSARRAAADGAHPDPAALHGGAASIGGVQIFPDLDLNGTFLGIWFAHTAFGLPLAVYLLAELHRIAAVVDHRVGADRRRRPLHDLLAARSSRCRCRRSRRSRSSSSSGCGTTCWSPTCSSGARRDTASLTDRARPTWSVARARTGTCSRRPRSSRWRCRWSCSSRCSGTSCAASPPAR